MIEIPKYNGTEAPDVSFSLCRKGVIFITAGFMTLGCRVNQYETEALAEELFKLGFSRGDFAEACDAYIINTCAVTEESVRKSRQMVRRAKKKNPDAFIGVMGCASQLESSDFARIEGVSFVCGTRNKQEMVRAAELYLKSGKISGCAVSVAPPRGALTKTCAVHSDRTRAYVKIEDGCNGKCSYCVIPFLRGDIVTRDEGEILDEVFRIAQNGCHEVVLTGIETAAYGNGLSRLIAKIDGIAGIERIRMGSLEPSFMKSTFIDSIYDVPSLCHHFHLSVQNGSDRILALMRRKYNTDMMERNIAYIREKIPDVNFSADVIVGFPGESEADFEQTCRFIKRVGFLHLHIFTYSKRPGTEAAEMEGQIPEKIKMERLHYLESIAQEEKKKILSRVIAEGKPVTVLSESVGEKYVTGHTGNFVECGILRSGLDSESEEIKGEFYKAIPDKIDGELLVCRRDCRE